MNSAAPDFTLYSRDLRDTLGGRTFIFLPLFSLLSSLSPTSHSLTIFLSLSLLGQSPRNCVWYSGFRWSASPTSGLSASFLTFIIVRSQMNRSAWDVTSGAHGGTFSSSPGFISTALYYSHFIAITDNLLFFSLLSFLLALSLPFFHPISFSLLFLLFSSFVFRVTSLTYYWWTALTRLEQQKLTVSG